MGPLYPIHEHILMMGDWEMWLRNAVSMSIPFAYVGFLAWVARMKR